ncbi:MAG: DUF1592 domain-containing protein [Myxococcaceae bacterium]
MGTRRHSHLARCLALSALSLSACAGLFEDAPGVSTAGVCTSFAPAPSLLRRLTPDEYLDSVEQVTGTRLSSQARQAFPRDVSLPGLLSNDLSLQSVSEQLVDAVSTIADEAAQAINLRSFVSCSFRNGSQANEACHQAFINAFAPLAFRRPLEAAEIDRLMTLARDVPDWTNGQAIDGSARVLVSAILQSPQFLFRVELSRPRAPERPGHIRIDDYEIASRLSFALLGQGPDAALMAAASRGELVTPDGLAAAVDRLTGDPRAATQRENFAVELFGLQNVDHLGPDATQAGTLAPLVPQIKAAAVQEVRLFGRELLGGSGNARELFRTNYVNVNGPLAQAYGIPGISASDLGFRRVAVAPDGSRGGLLTSAAYMLLGSHAGEPSDTLRGKFVRQTLMCGPRMTPPADATQLEIQNGAGTRMTRASCRGCHRMMDPIGYAVAHYDVLGRIVPSAARTDGYFIDTNTGDEVPLQGPAGVSDAILGNDAWNSCLVQKTLQWVSGRALTPEDSCTIESARAAFADSDFRGSALWTSLLNSEALKYRRAEAQP